MSNNLYSQTTEQTAQKAVVSYFPESMDDDSRVWRISGDSGSDALAHIDIGSTITFALNEPSRPVGVLLEDWPYRRPTGIERDFSQDRALLAELFGDEVANLMGRVPQVPEVPEDDDDFDDGIIETEVSVEVKNPELARILGRLATIDFIRGERRSSYVFTEEKKQEMVNRFIELDGTLTESAQSLINFHERIQAAKDRFFSQNRIPNEEELGAEEDQLLVKLTEWLPLDGLHSWIRSRKSQRKTENREELCGPALGAGVICWLDRDETSKLVLVMGVVDNPNLPFPYDYHPDDENAGFFGEVSEQTEFVCVLPIDTENEEPNMTLFRHDFPNGVAHVRILTDTADIAEPSELRALDPHLPLPSEVYEDLFNEAQQPLKDAYNKPVSE